MAFPSLTYGTHSVRKYVKLIKSDRVILTKKVNTINPNSQEIQDFLEEHSADSFVPFYISQFKIKDLMHKSDELDPSKLKSFYWQGENRGFYCKGECIFGLLEEGDQIIRTYAQTLTKNGWDAPLEVYNRDLTNTELTDRINNPKIKILKFYNESEVLFEKVEHKSQKYNMSEIYIGKSVEPEELKDRLGKNNFETGQHKSNIEIVLDNFYASSDKLKIIQTNEGYDLIQKNSLVLRDFA